MQPEPTTQELLDQITALKEDRAWEARRANEAARLSAEARDQADHLRKQIADLQEQVKIVEEDRTRHDAWTVRVCHQHGIDIDHQLDDLNAAIAKYLRTVVAERDTARRERDRVRRALAEHATDCDECEPEVQGALGLGPDPVEVERDAMRPVVDAARAYWAKHGKRFLGPQSAERDALINALTQSTGDGAAA